MDKIDELRLQQGYADKNIFVITNDPDSLMIVSQQSDIDLRYPEGSWFEQVKSFLGGDEPIRGAFKHMGFTREEALEYYNEVENGGILLFVNRKKDQPLNHQEVGNRESYVDPNIGSNMVAKNLHSATTDDTLETNGLRQDLLDEDLFDNRN